MNMTYGWWKRSWVSGVVGALFALSATGQTGIEVVPYGRVKVDASYDNSRVSPGDWAAFALPRLAGEKDDEFNFTARDSRFGFRLRAPEVDGLKTAGLIEMDFLGSGPANSPNPRLRLAYVDVAGSKGWALRVGQEWDLFAVYHPHTIDPGALGNAGNPRGFRPQARISRTVNVSEAARWVAAVAVTRNIGQDLDGAGQDDGSDSGRPALQAGLALHTPGAAGRPLTLAVAGLYGKETVDDVTRSATTNAFGTITETVRITDPDATAYHSWLVHLAAVVPLSSTLSFQGVVWTGENLDAYLAGIGQGVNTAAKTEIGSSGGYAQLTAKVADQLSLTAGYGLDDAKDEDLSKGARSRNSRLFGNAQYALTPAVSLGAEVSQIETRYKESETAEALRVAFSSHFRF